MRQKTGYTGSTKRHLLLGAGAIFKNFVVGTDTYESSKSKIIGATQGGNEFKAAPVTHNIQVDGILGKAADLDVIDSWDTSLVVNFIEVTKDVICAALGATQVDASDDDYYIIKGDTKFDAEDYFENVTFIGTISGSSTPVIVQVKNAINLGGLSLKVEDGKEGVVTVTFEGRYTTDAEDEPPFAIYFPKVMTASKSTVEITGTGTATFSVAGGAGDLTVASSSTSIATATITTGTVTVTGVAAGTAIITVTDENNDTVQVKAVVSAS